MVFLPEITWVFGSGGGCHRGSCVDPSPVDEMSDTFDSRSDMLKVEISEINN